MAFENGGQVLDWVFTWSVWNQIAMMKFEVVQSFVIEKNILALMMIDK